MKRTNLSKYMSKSWKMAMKVKIIEPLLKVQTADLRIWEMKKKSRRSSMYVLNNFLKTNCMDNNLMLDVLCNFGLFELTENYGLRLSSFRHEEELYFVVSKILVF